MRIAADRLETARGIDELCTLSTVIHSNSQKEKEAKRGSSCPRVGDFRLISDRIEHAGEDLEAQMLFVA